MGLTRAPAAPRAQQSPADCSRMPETPSVPLSLSALLSGASSSFSSICSCPQSSPLPSLPSHPDTQEVGFSQPARSLGQGRSLPPGFVTRRRGARGFEL